MKYIKTYEDEEIPNIPVNFKIGDHVRPIKSSTVYKSGNNRYTIFDEIYTIVRIYPNDNRTKDLKFSTNPLDVCDIKDDNNKIYTTWFLKRFQPAEVEYSANKYNL